MNPEISNSDLLARVAVAEEILDDLSSGYWLSVLRDHDILSPVGRIDARVLGYWAMVARQNVDRTIQKEKFLSHE